MIFRAASASVSAMLLFFFCALVAAPCWAATVLSTSSHLDRSAKQTFVESAPKDVVARVPTVEDASGYFNLTRQAAACGGNSVLQCSFLDRFDRNVGRWKAADGYANGEPFDAWWSRAKAILDLKNKYIKLSVGNQPNFGKPYVAGQMQSNKWHGYGCYEVRMKPVKQEGLITTFFTYTGTYDAAPGAPKAHNEVDIEFVWKQNLKKMVMQSNYFTNGRGGNEKYIQLPFAMEKAFHNYAFRWTSKGIEWFVDGRKVYTATKNTPKAGGGPQKIMMNVWPVSAAATGWGGFYKWLGSKTVLYQAVRYTSGEDCSIKNWF